MLVELHHGGGIAHLVAERDIIGIALHRLLDHLEVEPELAREGLDGLEILQQLPRIARRRLEGALLHLRVEPLQQAGIGMAAGQALRQARGVDAGGLGQHQGLGHHDIARADDRLVDDLGGLAGPDRTHMRDVAGHFAPAAAGGGEILVASRRPSRSCAPVRASCGPPETGASTQPAPVLAFSLIAACRVPSGSAVERSMTSCRR